MILAILNVLMKQGTLFILPLRLKMPTQLYLYRVTIDKGNFLQQVAGTVKKVVDAVGKSKDEAELVSPKNLKGTHSYTISPNGKFATHSFSNHNTPTVREWVILPDNKPVNAAKSIASNIKTDDRSDVEYFRIITR